MFKNGFSKIWLIAGIISIGLYLVHFTIRSPLNNYERPIIGDAMAYYAYLPAVFIYQDADYTFLDEIEQKHYFPGAKKNFLVSLPNGEQLNKTYPGAALLYLPFFLIAHFLALLFSDADGYSLIYQLLFEVGHFFYVFLGVGWMTKILVLKNISINKSVLSVLLLIASTNYLYYLIFDLSLVHIHSMALINGSIYTVLKWQKTHYNNNKFLLFTVLLFCLAVISRPTNLLVVLLWLVFLSDRKLFINQVLNLFQNPKILLKILGIGLAVISITISLWYWQAGVFIAYSYGEEGFNFAQPETLNFLFSYNNGWLLYSPILLIILSYGLYLLLNKDKVGALWTSLFLMLSVYIFSSWWCWYYGCSFGQRTMVDFYVIIAYLIALMIQSRLVQRLKWLLILLLAFTSFLNIHQSYQNFNGYIECGLDTSEMYWDNFMSFRKKSKVYLKEGEEVVYTKIFYLNKEEESVTGLLIPHEDAYSNPTLTKTDKEHQFSATIQASIPVIAYDYIIASFYVNKKSDLQHSRFIIEQPDIEGSYRSYGFQDYAIKDKWIKVSFKYIPSSYDAELKLYFWNGDTAEDNWYDDVTIEFIKQD